MLPAWCVQCGFRTINRRRITPTSVSRTVLACVVVTWTFNGFQVARRIGCLEVSLRNQLDSHFWPHLFANLTRNNDEGHQNLMFQECVVLATVNADLYPISLDRIQSNVENTISEIKRSTTTGFWHWGWGWAPYGRYPPMQYWTKRLRLMVLYVNANGVSSVQGTRRRANRPKQTFLGPDSYADDGNEYAEEKLAVVGAYPSNNFRIIGF